VPFSLQKYLNFNPETLRNFGKLLSGNILAQGITIGVALLLSRIYEPVDFGVFSIFNSFTLILAVVAAGRFELAIVAAEKEVHAQKLFQLALRISLYVFLGLQVVFLLFSDEFAEWVTMEEEYHWILWLVPLGTLASSLNQVLGYLSNRFKEYGSLSLAKVNQSLASSAGSLGLGVMQAHPLGLVTGNILGHLANFFTLWWKNKNQPWFRFRGRRVGKSLFKRYKDFPTISLPAALIDTISVNIPIFMIVALFDTTITGHYGFAYRLLNLPVVLIGMSVSQIFFQRFSELYHQGGNYQGFLVKTWGFLSLIGILPFTLLFFYGPELFTLFFGKKWLLAGEMSRIMSPMLFIIFISSPTSTVFVSLRKQNLLLLYSIISLIGRPLCIYYGYMENSIMLGLWWLTWFEIAVRMVFNVINYRISSGNEDL
jgi:lipopolysaccharide exporter